MCWHYITSIVGPRVILLKSAYFCPRIVFHLRISSNSADLDGMPSLGILSESKLFIEVFMKIKLLALESDKIVFYNKLFSYNFNQSI